MIQASRFIAFCGALAVVSVSGLLGQEAKTSEKERSDAKFLTDARLNKMEYAIAGKSGSVKQETLERDRGPVAAAYKSIDKYYSDRGFNQPQIEGIVELAWTDIRTDKHNTIKLDSHGQFSEAEFARYATEQFGGLKVLSTPPGATIEIDGKKWIGLTNASAEARVGKHAVKLSKSGFLNEQGDVIVVAGRWATFQRRLHK